MRKNIGKLSFVDRKRFKEGVSFDAKYQILHFAKNRNSINTSALAKAISAAGFDAVTLYTFDGKKLRTTNIEKL